MAGATHFDLIIVPSFKGRRAPPFPSKLLQGIRRWENATPEESDLKGGEKLSALRRVKKDSRMGREGAMHCSTIEQKQNGKSK